MMLIPQSQAGDCHFDTLPAWACSCWQPEGAKSGISDRPNLAAGSDLRRPCLLLNEPLPCWLVFEQRHIQGSCLAL